MTHPIRRRTLISGGGHATVAVAACAATAQAAARSTSLSGMVPSLSKAAVGYRDIPWKGQVCGACVWFKLPSPGSTVSHCHLVAGPISAAGWCQAWMRRG